jgi:diguanylate cyclase (GGDEF)-like protein
MQSPSWEVRSSCAVVVAVHGRICTENQSTRFRNDMKSPIVFLVHGHDVGVLNSVTQFLKEQLRLDVVILHERPNMGRTIIEKLEANSNDVGFAVVLLTPDDVGASKKSKGKPNKRARQNVILELGYFIGKLGRERVCAIYVKDIELPSDFDGILYVPYDRRGDWRSKLTTEIEATGIEVDQTKFKVNEERANRDAITGLFNRRFFEEALLAECERAKDTDGIFSVIFLDLDKFKKINDTHGQAQGDKLIKRVGIVLDRTHSRGQTLSRIGGDEFAILVPGLGTEEAFQMADGLRFALGKDNVLRKWQVTGSFGVASYPQDGTTPDNILRAGDEQVYQSKQAGGNRVSA